jgi:ABC-type sugar transport system ATPase subunit
LTFEGKTIIVVSSDMTEVLGICQRIIVMHEGTIKGILSGENRTEYEIMQRAANVIQADVNQKEAV